MILVVGATGLVGSEICGLLAARGKQVRALVRATADPAKVDRLTALGAEIVTGDLRDPASLRNACRGMSAIVTTATALPLGYQPGINTPQTTDQNGYLSLITAARETGVPRFVYTSFPPITAAFPLQDAKRATEASLRSSGLTYTILQPTYFSEVWLARRPDSTIPTARRPSTARAGTPSVGFRTATWLNAPSLRWAVPRRWTPLWSWAARRR